jgi:hypothetical protein
MTSLPQDFDLIPRKDWIAADQDCIFLAGLGNQYVMVK